MCKKECALFLVVVAAVFAAPAKDELMFDMGGDTAVVESTVRETRAVPEHIEDLIKPGVKQAYIHLYGTNDEDDGNEQGYDKKTSDKSADGYKHYDSYHKKDKDKYAYEKHSEFGKGRYAESDTGKGDKDDDEGHETKHRYSIVDDSTGKGKKKAIESYEGGLDGGFDGDGDSGHYSEGYAEGGEGGSSYSEGGGESSHYEQGSEDDGDGESAHYTAGEGGESESYTAEDEGEDDY